MHRIVMTAALLTLTGCAARSPVAIAPPALDAVITAAVLDEPAAGTQSPTFTLQGRLLQNGVPANDPIEGAYVYFYADNGFSATSGTHPLGLITPVDGLFTVEIPFFARDLFAGLTHEVWVEIYNGSAQSIGGRIPIRMAPRAYVSAYAKELLDSTEWAFEFNAPFRNYGQEYANCRAIRRGDMVYLEGLVQGNSNTPGLIATLPAGYRPGARQIFAASYQGSTARLDILANGQVRAITSTPDGWISLSGVAFKAEN